MSRAEALKQAVEAVVSLGAGSFARSLEPVARPALLDDAVRLTFNVAEWLLSGEQTAPKLRVFVDSDGDEWREEKPGTLTMYVEGNRTTNDCWILQDEAAVESSFGPLTVVPQ